MSFQRDAAKDRRTIQEQVSDLAYRLWEARSRPLGSPEVDWFLAERLVNEYRQASPFDAFLRKATKALNSPTTARGVRDDVEYARVIEERRYLIDVLDRAEMLAFTYSRLKALSGLYREAEAQMDTTKHVTSEEPITWEVPDEIAWQRDYRALEARVLVSFVYYELTSVSADIKHPRYCRFCLQKVAGRWATRHTNAVARDVFGRGRVWELRDDEERAVGRYPTLPRRRQEQEHWNSERVWRPAGPIRSPGGVHRKLFTLPAILYA